MHHVSGRQGKQSRDTLAVATTHRSLKQLRALNAIYDPDNKAVTELLALARDCCHVVPLPEQYWQESTQRVVFLAGMRLVGFCHVLRVQDLQTLLLTLQYVSWVSRARCTDCYI